MLETECERFTVDDSSNKGKPISQLKMRQIFNKLKELKSNAQVALWFINSFGMTLKTLEVEDDSGKTHNLNYRSRTSNSNGNLSDTEKEKVKSLLYILDKFGIAQEGYHELTYHSDSLYKSYLINSVKIPKAVVIWKKPRSIAWCLNGV